MWSVYKAMWSYGLCSLYCLVMNPAGKKWFTWILIYDKVKYLLLLPCIFDWNIL